MDAENELFDAASEVLEATLRLGAAATDRGCERAVPATLGCLSTALGSLADTSADLRALAGSGDRAVLTELSRTLKRAAWLADAARCARVPRR
jgi:hypothetical protein